MHPKIYPGAKVDFGCQKWCFWESFWLHLGSKIHQQSIKNRCKNRCRKNDGKLWKIDAKTVQKCIGQFIYFWFFRYFGVRVDLAKSSFLPRENVHPAKSSNPKMYEHSITNLKKPSKNLLKNWWKTTWKKHLKIIPKWRQIVLINDSKINREI